MTMNNQKMICLAVELKIILASDDDDTALGHHLSLSAKPLASGAFWPNRRAFRFIRQNRILFDALSPPFVAPSTGLQKTYDTGGAQVRKSAFLFRGKGGEVRQLAPPVLKSQPVAEDVIGVRLHGTPVGL